MKQGRLRRTQPSVGESIDFRIEVQENRLLLQLDEKSLELEIFQGNAESGWCRWQDRLFPFAYQWIGEEIHIWLDGTVFVFISESGRVSRLDDLPKGIAASQSEAMATSAVQSRTITTGISGMVLVVCVGLGDTVSVGDEVCVIEAMKMEHSIRSNIVGVVAKVLVRADQQVSAGDSLISLEQESVAAG